jgi:hypothetical protein
MFLSRSPTSLKNSLKCTSFFEYVGVEHFNYLLKVLKKFHGVQFNMAGNKFAGIDIE